MLFILKQLTALKYRKTDKYNAIEMPASNSCCITATQLEKMQMSIFLAPQQHLTCENGILLPKLFSEKALFSITRTIYSNSES